MACPYGLQASLSLTEKFRDRSVIDSPEILRLLARAPLFTMFPTETLRTICANAKLVTLLQGDKLLSLGKINEHIYVVASGD